MARPRSEGMTPRQREVFEWIKGFIREHRFPPTVREIGRAFGIKSSSVFDHLKALEQKGYVERGKLTARSLVVKGRKHATRHSAGVSVVGRIAAGRPIEAIEHDRGELVINRELLRGGSGYALQVVGDSMVEAGILDGDYVIVRKQDTAEDGDIVVALIDDEATLKRFYCEKNHIRLEPANRSMKAIRVESGEFRIQGKVVAVHRRL